jgi:hypothetical protein
MMNRSLPFALLAKLSSTAASPAVAFLTFALSLSVRPSPKMRSVTL